MTRDFKPRAFRALREEGPGRRLAAAVLGLGLSLSVGPSGCNGRFVERSISGAFANRSALGVQSACLPQFADRGAWQGGDAAASVPLPHGDGRTSLWLFGDSFVERTDSPHARAYPFVHNAVAVSHCRDRGAWRMEFAWGGQTDPAPRAFFEPDPNAEWVKRIRTPSGDEAYYWPISGTVVRGTLVVALLRGAPAAARGPFQLPFRLVGVDLAQIENSSRPPHKWSIRISTLSSRADILPASSLVANGDYLYAFSFLDRGDGRSPRILTRLPIDALASRRPDLEHALETLAQDGRWIPGLALEAARILMADDASEMSVHFDPGLREWLAVYSDPANDAGGPPSDVVWLRRAKELEGPWSERVALWHIPELADSSDPEPGEPFCYAAKAHPQFAESGRLLVSYVCNVFAETEADISAVLERLRTTPSLYRPRAVRLAVPR